VDIQQAYHLLYRIRNFEETILENFSKGVFYGTTHTYIGQEANAVGVLHHLQQHDIVFSNHRCHGHFLAYGGDMRALLAEMMGKATGVCGGRGGSQHLHWRNFYSNGVQGGILPVATGMALAEKFKQTEALAVVFLGDGTMGEGVTYEALNLASLWGAPVLFVVENNHIAQTTPIELAVAGNIAARFAAFDIQVHELATADLFEILPVAEKCLQTIRSANSPQALILHTQRFGPHSKGDDTRPPEELARLREQHDPIKTLEKRLRLENIELIQAKVQTEVKSALEQALDDPFPNLDKVQSRPG
jgi:TPP-dependent pyruvate/acetoin dehydrogenase alpha subunit